MPMLRILHHTKIDFIKSWRIAVGITAVFIVSGLAFLGIHGVNRSIEFTGGTLMQIHFKKADPNVGDIHGGPHLHCPSRRGRQGSARARSKSKRRTAFLLYR